MENVVLLVNWITKWFNYCSLVICYFCTCVFPFFYTLLAIVIMTRKKTDFGYHKVSRNVKKKLKIFTSNIWEPKIVVHVKCIRKIIRSLINLKRWKTSLLHKGTRQIFHHIWIFQQCCIQSNPSISCSS